MSSHRTQTRKCLVNISVDRPLRQILASVMTTSGRPAPGFPAMTSSPATTEGVDEAATTIETFIRETEPGWSLPETVRDALLDDVRALEAGRDINYVRVHTASDG
ncbi:MAG: hypothetical protein JNM34_09935 [Chthonomonadaceae bacterium]|nr:hypothetical protein [Chthonomonadaceae bacterium]